MTPECNAIYVSLTSKFTAKHERNVVSTRWSYSRHGIGFDDNVRQIFSATIYVFIYKKMSLKIIFFDCNICWYRNILNTFCLK